MATKDTSETDEKLRTETEIVETDNTEDENLEEDQDTSENDTEDDSEDETEDDDESETEDEDEAIKKRFTQFKGDTYEDYTPKLEEAYGNLLAEMTRVRQADKEKTGKLDAVIAAASKDPEFAKKLNELMGDEAQDVTVDPAILKARQDMNAQMDKEYKEFVEAHPEMESDPNLAQEVVDILADFGKQARKQNKILGMGEALRKAWVFLGKDDNAEKVAIKAKEVASKTKTGSSAKKSSGTKPQFSAEQIAFAKKWGLTPEQLAAANKTNT